MKPGTGWCRQSDEELFNLQTHKWIELNQTCFLQSILGFLAVGRTDVPHLDVLAAFPFSPKTFKS